MSYTLSHSSGFMKIFDLKNPFVAQQAEEILSFLSQAVNGQGAFDFQKAQQMIADRSDMWVVNKMNFKVDGLSMVFPIVVNNYPLVQDPELFHFDFSFFTEANLKKLLAHYPPFYHTDPLWHLDLEAMFEQAANDIYAAQQMVNLSYAQNPARWEPFLLCFLVQQIFKGNTQNYTVKNFFYEVTREAYKAVCRMVNHEVGPITQPILNFVTNSFSNIGGPVDHNYVFYSKSATTKSGHSFMNNMIAYAGDRLYCMPFGLLGNVDFEEEKVLGISSGDHHEMSITVQGLLIEQVI